MKRKAGHDVHPPFPVHVAWSITIARAVALLLVDACATPPPLARAPGARRLARKKADTCVACSFSWNADALDPSNFAGHEGWILDADHDKPGWRTTAAVEAGPLTTVGFPWPSKSRTKPELSVAYMVSYSAAWGEATIELLEGDSRRPRVDRARRRRRRRARHGARVRLQHRQAAPAGDTTDTEDRARRRPHHAQRKGGRLQGGDDHHLLKPALDDERCGLRT